MSKSIKGLVKALSNLAVAGLTAFAAMAAAQTPAADASNAIERIDASQTATGVVLMIDMKNPVQGTPASFSWPSGTGPLDLPGAVNAVGRNQVELNQGDLRSVNIVQASGRSRVVLNLKRPLTHAVSIDGKRILVALGGATDTTTFRPTAAPAAAAAPSDSGSGNHDRSGASPPRAVPVHCVESISGAAAEGEAVSSSTCRTEYERRHPPAGQHGGLDFLNTTLPDSLKRRLDVSDFATPVNT